MRRSSWLLFLVAACGGDPTTEFPTAPAGAPQADFQPATLVDLGEVPVDAVRTAELTIENTGQGLLRIESVELVGARPDVWTTEYDETIPPDTSGTLRVTYTPCPELWVLGTTASPCDCVPQSDAPVLRVTTNASPSPTDLVLRGISRALGPRISLDPPLELAFGEASSATVTIRNEGCGELEIDEIDLTAPGGAPAPPQFTLDGCEAWPCAITETVCNEGCAVDIALEYRNDDLVTEDYAELRFRTNDPETPERILALTATGDPGELPCLPPTPFISVSPTRPCVGEPLVLDAAGSHPSSPNGTITGYSWAVAFSQPPPVELTTSEGGRVATFEPTEPGLYIFVLTVESSCGPPATLTEQVLVSTGCR